jgi:putative endonuclease
MISNNYYIYILSGKSNRVLYTGRTGNLKTRIYQHKHKTVDGFSSKYCLNKLVYYEIFNKKDEAIKREKQIKAGSRKKKEELINKMNPRREDLYDKL